jgi:thiosulfate/3-mercaptopyruvate sulfurtransferase
VTRSLLSRLLRLSALAITIAFAGTLAALAEGPQAEWSSLITAEQLHARLERPNLLVIDVRSPAEYSAGHLPGAINLPGSQWRTPATKNPAKEGVGQKIFRKDDGSLDTPRYEALLGQAGVKPEHELVIYGNHAGKADGSVPAAILLKLGHARVSFLDGIGLDVWRAAGYPVSVEPRTLTASVYKAPGADPKRLWSLEDVKKNLKTDDVVFLDSRTPEEYAGTALRGNQRGGHIPGAVLVNSEDFLDPKTKATISPAEARKKLEALQIPKDKKIVIYCQSGTRCSHKELILKDLGYSNVFLYDASWQEWGNREDTPIESSGPQPKK